MATSSIGTVVFQRDYCAILQYPEWLRVHQLVRSPYGMKQKPVQDDATANEGIALKHKSRKRRRHQRSFNEEEESQSQYHEKIRGLLVSCYDALKDAAWKIKYFPVLDNQHLSSEHVECSVDLAKLCSIHSIEDVAIADNEPQVLRLTDDKVYSSDTDDVVGKIVCNDGSHDIHFKSGSQTFVVPSQSSFLLSDISMIHLLIDYTDFSESYNIIVIDPPWENKSAIRGKKYQWLDNEDILQLPIELLSAEGCLVAVWVTNKLRLVNWVKETLFPYWKIQFEAEWFWLKVTTSGELVFNLDSPHKKPYEVLLIGRKIPSSSSSSSSLVTVCHWSSKGNISSTETNDSSSSRSISERCLAVEDKTGEKEGKEQLVIPKRYVFMCIPSLVHSQKPFVGDLLKQYVVGSERPIKGLELFARNLTPGWTSWGNEVLKFQAVL